MSKIRAGGQKQSMFIVFVVYVIPLMILQLHNTELRECTKAQSLFAAETKAGAWQWEPCLVVFISSEYSHFEVAAQKTLLWK